jgi:hypothetical protein
MYGKPEQRFWQLRSNAARKRINGGSYLRCREKSRILNFSGNGESNNMRYLFTTLCLVFILCTAASAATITVTNTNDSGAGSLRQAIADAAPGETITFNVTGTISLTSGQLIIDKNLIIQGPGAGLLSISGNNASRVFLINSGITATLDGLTIANGRINGAGGGILNEGTLTVKNSSVTGNSTVGVNGNGGGIWNQGILTVVNTTVADNIANHFCGFGGGIFNTGTLTVNHSTISGNQALSVEECGGGGGIASFGPTVIHNSAFLGNHGENYNGGGGGILNGGPVSSPVMTVTNSTISGNTNPFNEGGGISNFGTLAVTGSTVSNNFGGGINNYGTLSANNSTVSGNTPVGDVWTAGGIRNHGGMLTVHNSTITGNDVGLDFFATYTSILRNTIVAGNTVDDIVLYNANFQTASHNLIGDAASSGGIQNGVNGNIVGVNPFLGPLRNNGGPTRTRALLNGSPGINAGINCVLTANGCGDGNPSLTTDQRGMPRNGTVDIGAFERQANEASSGAPFDFDGDGRSDVSVFRPSDSVWYLNQSVHGFTAVQFGLPTDKIVPADYNGDGMTDIAVFRDGTWWLRQSSSGAVQAIRFGVAGDIPVPADYTGDGRDELAVYCNGEWWAFDLSNNQSSVLHFGLTTDKPVPGDYDGDGHVDQAVYRNGEWHLNRSTRGYTVVRFGLSTDTPVVGDYDADGKSDIAVYRDGTWYLLQSTAGFRAFQWGIGTDIPAPADYDGDGKTDPAVYRDGVWYLLQSTGNVSIQYFGLASDKPVASAFVP